MVGIRQRSPGGGRKTDISAVIIATMIHIILTVLLQSQTPCLYEWIQTS